MVGVIITVMAAMNTEIILLLSLSVYNLQCCREQHHVSRETVFWLGLLMLRITGAW